MRPLLGEPKTNTGHLANLDPCRVGARPRAEGDCARYEHARVLLVLGESREVFRKLLGVSDVEHHRIIRQDSVAPRQPFFVFGC